MENEKAVIGACFLDDFGLDTVLSILKPDHFGVSSYRRIFEIICDLSKDNNPVDLVSIANEDKSVVTAASDALDFVPSSGNAKYYAEKVLESYQSRKLQGLAAAIQENEDMKPSELLSKIDSELLTIGNVQQQQYVHIKEAVRSATAMQDQKGYLGIRSYWPKFDKQFSGLCPGSLYCIAGRPGMGKTAWATCLALNVGRKKPVAYFTLEMSKEEVSTRMLCAMGRINITRARNREMKKTEQADWLQASTDLWNMDIYVDDSGSLSIAQLKSKARTMKRKHGIELLIVDYLQLMSGTGDNRQQEIGSISRGLKLLAKDLQIPGVVLSQLNRGLEQRTDKRPMLSDLRESGDIEQDCDAVIMLYRKSEYDDAADKSEADWIIRKNRNGGSGNIKASWTGEYCYYTELDGYGERDQ